MFDAIINVETLSSVTNFSSWIFISSANDNKFFSQSFFSFFNHDISSDDSIMTHVKTSCL